jgi:hypothetical protein
MTKPSLMNLHILILILLNGHKISCPQQQKSLKEPEDKIGEPSHIRGNKFSHLSLKDFKETGDETFAWESFENGQDCQSESLHCNIPPDQTVKTFS